MRSTSDRGKLLLAAAVGAAAGTVLVLLVMFNPALSRVFPPCPFHWLTGLYCPGCGSLRALHNLLHGNINAALVLNPLMIVSIPVLGIMLAKPTWFRKKWIAWLTFLVMTGYGIARNIPAWPFTLLAPQ